MELCDWLLVKDDVSRLTGDIGGVGLLHSECEREPGVAEEKGKKKKKKIRLAAYCCNLLSHSVAIKCNSTSVRSRGAGITSWRDLNALCSKL